MKNLLFGAIIFLLFACNNKPEGTITGDIGTGNVVPETSKVSEYTLEQVPGTKMAKK